MVTRRTKPHIMTVTDLLHHFITLFENWLPESGGGKADLLQTVTYLQQAGEPQAITPIVPPVVQEWLEPCCAQPSLPQHEACLQTLREAAPLLRWIAPAVAYAGEQMAQSYAFVRIIGPPLFGQESAPFFSDKVAAGFSIQSPNVYYAPHWHPAVEFYSPLTGTGLWQIDDGPFVAKQPGTLIHHPSNAPHAMQTNNEPTLNAFTWVGDILTRPTVDAL